jgi:hypothetical protein
MYLLTKCTIETALVQNIWLSYYSILFFFLIVFNYTRYSNNTLRKLKVKRSESRNIEYEKSIKQTEPNKHYTMPVNILLLTALERKFNGVKYNRIASTKCAEEVNLVNEATHSPTFAVYIRESQVFVSDFYLDRLKMTL